MSSSLPATVKWSGSTSGAWAGSRLLTASIPNRSVDASQFCHSLGSRAASHGWISMSGSFGGRGICGDQALDWSHTRSEARAEVDQVLEQFLGGGVQRLVGDGGEFDEDVQRRGGVVTQLGSVSLAPVTAPAGHA